jgi:hypothetical protein
LCILILWSVLLQHQWNCCLPCLSAEKKSCIWSSHLWSSENNVEIWKLLLTAMKSGRQQKGIWMLFRQSDKAVCEER